MSIGPIDTGITNPHKDEFIDWDKVLEEHPSTGLTAASAPSTIPTPSSLHGGGEGEFSWELDSPKPLTDRVSPMLAPAFEDEIHEPHPKRPRQSSDAATDHSSSRKFSKEEKDFLLTRFPKVKGGKEKSYKIGEVVKAHKKEFPDIYRSAPGLRYQAIRVLGIPIETLESRIWSPEEINFLLDRKKEGVSSSDIPKMYKKQFRGHKRSRRAVQKKFLKVSESDVKEDAKLISLSVGKKRSRS